MKTSEKAFVKLCDYRSPTLQGVVAFFIQWHPEAVGAQVIERQSDVRPLRATFGHYDPEGEEAEDEFPRQGEPRTCEHSLLNEFRYNQEKERLVRSDIAFSVNAEVTSDLKPVLGIGWIAHRVGKSDIRVRKSQGERLPVALQSPDPLPWDGPLACRLLSPCVCTCTPYSAAS